MGNSVSVKIGVPLHGWLPFDFQYNEWALEIDASDVLNDPIEEIYTSIIRLSEGKTGQVTYWLEPATYYFYFETKNDLFTLTISESDDIDCSENNRRIVKVITGNYKQIVAPFKKALFEFCSRNYEEKHWPYALNKSKLKLIK